MKITVLLMLLYATFEKSLDVNYQVTILKNKNKGAFEVIVLATYVLSIIFWYAIK